MQPLRLTVALALVLLAASSALADKVRFDYEHGVDFSKFKTFMWIEEPKVKDPLVKARIMESVNMQLVARGLRQVSQGADLNISSSMTTEEKRTWQTYYNGTGVWGWAGGSTADTTVRTYEVGTLTVNLYSSHNKKLVWQGVSVSTLSSRPEKRAKNSAKSVEKMFKDFPPPFVEQG
jgi:uncharacterized protein DUF4136